jgi:type I restriction enzyme, S subunit
MNELVAVTAADMSDSHWRVVDLGSVAHLEMGQAPSSQHVSDRQGSSDWPFLQGNAEFTATSPEARLWCSRPAKIARAGDSLISVRAPVGALNLADQEYCIGRGLAAVRFRTLLPRFGHYQLALKKDDLHRVAQGSTFDAIGSKELRELQFLIPTDHEQRRIAEILDALDDQIRLTSDVISKLDLAGRGLLDALLSQGVDATGHLRPIGSFEVRRGASGSFPASWAVVRLDQIADVDRGKFGHRPRNDPMYLSGPFPFIQTGDIATADGGVIVNTSQSLSRLGAAVSREFAAGTIAVTIAANIADTATLGRPMYFPDSVVGVSVHAPHRLEYVQFVLRAAKPRLEARAPQSAQRNINLQDLRPLDAFSAPLGV